jgi:hypothetical protein
MVAGAGVHGEVGGDSQTGSRDVRLADTKTKLR